MRYPDLRSFLRFGVALCIAAATNACGSLHPYWIAGHSDDFAQVYAGTGTSDNHTEQFTLKFESTGDRCTGSGELYSYIPEYWRVSFSCGSGLTGDLLISRTGGTLWHGDFVGSDGRHYFDIESNVESDVEPQLAIWRRSSGNPVSAASNGADAKPPQIEGTLSRAKAAEDQDKLSEALAIYVEALQRYVTRFESVPELVDRAIDVAIRIRPLPALSESVMRHATAGEAAVKSAREKADLAVARREFANALSEAPWWSDGWFNLAMLDQQIGNSGNVRRELIWYLRAAPDAPDRDSIRKQIESLH